MTGGENEKKKINRPAQIILILRLIAGGYLVYLAYELIEEVWSYTGIRQILLLAAMTVFFITGAAMVIWTVRKLIKGEFLRPWQHEDDFED